MRLSTFRLPIAVALGLTLAAFSASPAAATIVKGEGYYSRFSFGATRGGLVFVDRVDADSGRVRAQVVGLMEEEGIFIVGRSIGCNGTPMKSNRVFRLTTMTDSEGDLWVNRSIVLKDLLVSSIWIGRTDGGDTPQCRASFNFESVNVATGDVNGDGAVGIKDGTSNTVMGLVEKRSNGRARLSIVVDPSDTTGNTYRMTFANRPCGMTPTRTFSLKLENVLVSSFKSRTVYMTQNQLDGLRSMRIHNLTTDQRGCEPLSILIALLLP